MNYLQIQKVVPVFFRNRYSSRWLKFNLNIRIVCAKLKRQFFRPNLSKLETTGINLHLGCGSLNHPKFINIDGLPAFHIHYVRAIDNLSPFKDNSVNFIYACHCLEHFSHTKVPNVLSEWLRVLKKDGVLRLSVPNFDVLIDIYKEAENEVDAIILPLMGGQYNKFDFHMTIFNRSSLERLLKSVGFKDVKEWQPGSCNLATFDDWSARKALVNGKYYPISLNLEALK